jgi:hypothetical protein
VIPSPIQGKVRMGVIPLSSTFMGEELVLGPVRRLENLD